MFPTELDLTEAILMALKSRESARDYKQTFHIFSELNLWHGIADIVIAHLDSEVLPERKTPFSIYEISLLRLLKKSKGGTLRGLPETLGVSRERCNMALKRLEDEWFIAIDQGNGIIRITQDYRVAVRNCFAIEAKLSNWRRALHQAYRYRWFSNEAYVFMPSERISAAKRNIDLFKELGVGLASITKDCKIRIEYKPRKTKPFCEKRVMLLNERVLYEKTISSKNNPVPTPTLMPC